MVMDDPATIMVHLGRRVIAVYRSDRQTFLCCWVGSDQLLGVDTPLQDPPSDLFYQPESRIIKSSEE